MGTVRRLASHFRRYWVYLAIAVFSTLVVVGSTLALPWIIGKELIDTALLEKGDVHLLNLVALGLLGLLGIKALFSFSQTYFTYVVSTRVTMDLRNQLYEHLQYLSLGFYRRKQTGEIISRVMNDVEVIQNAVTRFLSNFFANALVLIGVLVAIFYLNWRLSLWVLAVIPLLAFTAGRFGKWIKQFTGFVQGKMAELSSRVQETVSGIHVVKSFGMESHEILRFHGLNRGMLELIVRRAKVLAALTPLMEILTFVGLVAVVWYGGREMVQGNLTMGELITFLGYIGLAVNPLSQVSQGYGFFQQASASADRVFEIMDTEREIQDKQGAHELSEVKGRVVFEHVSFGYTPHEMVLRDVNLVVEAGEKLALVGASGVGKTTLVSLIPRFYDPQAGCIRVDGWDIRDVTTASLRRHISIVSQETILFSGTVAQNIAYGKRDATREQIEYAALQANIHQFIVTLPQKYKTQVGERGLQLSGGQRQRIAIARAILRNPRILILDEATSALDTETESQVKHALDHLLQRRTAFVIAHRLSTILDADRVAVIDRGGIQEMGSHQELLARNGIYARLYRAQFTTSKGYA